jgi:hypothetical protein
VQMQSLPQDRAYRCVYGVGKWLKSRRSDEVL